MTIYKMAIIRYTVGHENSVITESENFSGSIFADQYRQAASLINNFIARNAEDALRIISFCGDRGSGKSSCMNSVVKLICDVQKPDNEEARKFADQFGFKALLNTKFEIPEIIDPSFFDENNNIIELILGQLYRNLQKYEHDHRDTLNRTVCNAVYDSVSKIRNSLLTIRGNEKYTFNDFSDLSVLSSAVSLKSSIRKLIQDYLTLIGKDKIIFVVDDIDLNIPGAYTMCEQIRKYLCMPECIVMISFKYDQLHSAVYTAMKKSFNKNTIPAQEIDDMVNRYLDKFVPTAQRIHMPVAYDLCNRTLRVYDESGRAVPFLQMTVMDAVVNLIFNKTRFLFYNSKGGVSPIVPDNLRELFQLIGMLWNMPDLPPLKESPERLETLEANKHAFKVYFFNYWTKCLDKKYLEKVKEWTQDTPYTILNKNVVRWLSSAFKTELDRHYDGGSEDSSNMKYASADYLIKQITVEENFSYNVSIGDVFFLVHLLEQDILSPQKEKMLFFIKSYYSILLFESYDIVTDYEGLPPFDEDKSGIYRIDHRFDHTNDLQRLVGGGYFTYRPGELIKNGVDGSRFDSRIIKGAPDFLTSLFKECGNYIENYDRFDAELQELEKIGQKSDEVKNRIKVLDECIQRMRNTFRLAEFFIFTVSRSIPQKNTHYFYSGEDSYRCDVAPYSLTQFNTQMGYYVFDILNPFYALCNPIYSYSRFDKLTGIKDSENSLFDFAIDHDFSILRRMIQLTYGDPDPSAVYWKETKNCLNSLQSDAVIRNAEVLMAIFENMVSVRDSDKDTSGLAKLSAFYNGISDSHMATHKVGTAIDSEPYKISFKFLKALTEFIDKDLSDEKALEEFYKIFDSALPARKSTDTNSIETTTPAQRVPPKVNLKKKTVAKHEAITMTPLEKGKFITRLKKYLGDEPLTAPEIKEKLKSIDFFLEDLDSNAMNVYVVRKSRNAKYTLSQLADYILKSRDRYELWLKLLGELDDITSELPF